MLLKQLKPLGFKIRSLPNLKTFKRYLSSFLILLAIVFAYNFIHITMIDDGFHIVVPDLMLFAVPIIFITTYHQIESEYKHIDFRDVGKAVMYIQLKRPQALSEELNERPELLNHKYKNKSLIYWAKYYNNKEAHSIITKHMRGIK